MKDINGNTFEVCPKDNRESPDALRNEAKRLRTKADYLEKLADQTDGMLSYEADSMLQTLLWHSLPK